MAAACAGVAALSLLLPSVPTTDPWGWIVWGRELSGLQLHTDVGGAPSWKPLPVFFTTVFALFGDAAPDLWLWLARAGGLVALVLAFLLGSRLAGRTGGVVAAVLLFLCGGLLKGLAHGYSEGIMLALLLGAVLSHLDGRRRRALGLLALASLDRPELWVVAVAYALIAARRGWVTVRFGLVLLAVPVLWVVPDWLGSGHLLHGGNTARAVSRRESGFEMLGSVAQMVGLGPGLLGLVGLALAAGRRPRAARALAVTAVGWTVIMVLMVELGYPPTERLLLPAVAALCLLAGAAVGWLVATPRALGARLAVGAALAALALVVAGPGPASLSDQLSGIEQRAELQQRLRAEAERSRSPEARANLADLPFDQVWNRGALAWEWHLPLKAVARLALRSDRRTVAIGGP